MLKTIETPLINEENAAKRLRFAMLHAGFHGDFNKLTGAQRVEFCRKMEGIVCVDETYLVYVKGTGKYMSCKRVSATVGDDDANWITEGEIDSPQRKLVLNALKLFASASIY